jgi:hypothetical protein
LRSRRAGGKKPRASPFLSHSIEIPSSRAVSEILYVVRLFSFISLRYWVPGYFGTRISKGNQFRYWASGAKAPEDHCRSAHIIVGCGMVTTDEGVATPFAPCLAIQAPAARIAEASRARSSVGRAPPSHGGGHEFESRRVHSENPGFARQRGHIGEDPGFQTGIFL